MLPQVNLNFGPLTLERVYLLLVPLIPGGLVVGGFLIAHSTFMTFAVAALGLGPYSKFVALIFACYVVGSALFFFSSIFFGVVTGLLGAIVFRKTAPSRDNLWWSRRPLWRKVATKLLGQGLIPQAPAASPGPLLNPILADLHDLEWQELYNVLQDYILRGIAILSNDTVVGLTGFQAMGWAVIVMASFIPAWRHPALLASGAFAILVGAAGPFLLLFNYWKFDRLTYWDFIARLLAEVHARDAQAAASIKRPPEHESTPSFSPKGEQDPRERDR